MRLMGVDPGLTRCGLSVVESGRGRQIIALDVDVARAPADEPLPRRLLAISDAVEYWHRPADAADALALAICHCWRAPMIARMAEAEAKVAEQRKKFAAKVRAAR